MRLAIVCTLFAPCLAFAQPAAPSKPRTERIQIPSKATGVEVAAAVHLPAGYDQGEQRYPVLYFLHGAGRGNENTWDERGTNDVVAKLVAKGKLPPCIVVCPRSPRQMCFYINWKGKKEQRYGDFVTDELPAFIDKKYRTRAERALRGLTGDSMGGFGALVNALRKPEVFGSVSAHEPAIYPEDVQALPASMRGGRRGGILTNLFGDPMDEEWWLAHNVFHIVKKAEKKTYTDLPIYFDVGKGDRYGLDAPCEMWHQLLKKKGVEHTFVLRDGGHGRRFFEDNVEHSLAHHGVVFQQALAVQPAEKKRD